MIVMDHGYNDNQCAILGMPADTNAQFIEVPEKRNSRYHFLGALNYLVDFILKSDSAIRIVLSGHYENIIYPNVAAAQETIATYLRAPLLKLWEKIDGPLPLNLEMSALVKNSWLEDGIHPSAIGKQLIANYQIEFFNAL